MKTLIFLTVAALFACDCPDPPTIEGYWVGTFWLASQVIPIEFDLCEDGEKHITGNFTSNIGSKTVNIDVGSAVIGDRISLVVKDTVYSITYLFYGIVDEDCKFISGKYTLTLPQTPPKTDSFLIHKN